jgi:hypothetical protein
MQTLALLYHRCTAVDRVKASAAVKYREYEVLASGGQGGRVEVPR